MARFRDPGVCFFNKHPDDSFDKASLEDTELDNLLNPFQSYQCWQQSAVGRAGVGSRETGSRLNIAVHRVGAGGLLWVPSQYLAVWIPVVIFGTNKNIVPG